MQVATSYLFQVPFNLSISVPVREANAHFAVSQAKGKLEFLIEMLDELSTIENKKFSSWDREEVIAKIVGHYEDLWVKDIKEIENEL
jgi:hypothetical protein